MIIFDLRLRSLEALCLKEATWSPFKVTREGLGEIIIDLPRASLTLVNRRRLPLPSSQ